jgi:hypothetical protein
LRGRWDDTEEEFRVLYLSSTGLGAFIETLQDLRQNADALRLLSQIEGDDEAPLETVTIVRDRLRNRYFADLIPSHPDELAIHFVHGATRTFLENHLANELSRRGIPHLKIGDVIGSDRSLSRRISRVLYDGGYNGVRAPSAEHGLSETIAVFENHSVSGHLRISLVPSSVHLALERGDIAGEAMRFLGMIPNTAQ